MHSAGLPIMNRFLLDATISCSRSCGDTCCRGTRRRRNVTQRCHGRHQDSSSNDHVHAWLKRGDGLHPSRSPLTHRALEVVPAPHLAHDLPEAMHLDITYARTVHAKCRVSPQASQPATLPCPSPTSCALLPSYSVGCMK